MRDSQIDLCGELGHKDDFPFLEEGDSFPFACNGCGDCCRGREDIVLSGYDLYRICQRLSLPPVVVVRGFCRRSVGEVSRLPVVRLRPVGEERNNCPFFCRGRCSIHEAEPLVCALYPLGQEIGLDGRVRYFAQPIDCGDAPGRAVCGEYLARYSVREREPIDVAWALACIGLSRKMRELEPRLLPAERKLAQLYACRALYLDLDPGAPYLPQLEKGVAAVESCLKDLSARAQKRTEAKNSG